MLEGVVVLTVLGVALALVGLPLFYRRQLLQADAAGHAILPAAASALLLTGGKSIPVMLVSCAIFVTATIWLTSFIHHKTRMDTELATALTLVVMFGGGTLLLGVLQQLGGDVAGIRQLLLGSAASLTHEDMAWIGVVALLVIFFYCAFFPWMKALMMEGRRTLQWRAGKVLWWGWHLCVALALVVGAHTGGVVLLVGVLAGPAMAASLLADSVSGVVVLTAGVAAMSVVGGTYLSALTEGLPTGPVLVAILMVAVLVAGLVGKNGIVARWWKHRHYRHKTYQEDILAALFRIEEEGTSPTLLALQRRTALSLATLRKTIRTLQQAGLIDENLQLTVAGKQKARRQVLIHRLVELYLTENTSISPHQVHAYAEELEHTVDNQLEELLRRKLAHHTYDPHHKPLPWEEHQ